MFSSKHFRTTAACAVALMMMMMMMKAAAMPKGAGHSKPEKTHRKSAEGAAVETVPLQLDPAAFASVKSVRPLQNLSISPWTYNTSHDDSVFPPVTEAHCLLEGCLDSEGQEDLSLESKPIMHQVLMLRRVRSAKEGHSYHYRLESRMIAVGCTCIRPIIQHQQ